MILTNPLGFQLLFKSLQTPCREPLQGRPILEPMREDSNNRDRPTDRVPKSDRIRPIGAEIHSLKQSIVMEDHESGVSRLEDVRPAKQFSLYIERLPGSNL